MRTLPSTSTASFITRQIAIAAIIASEDLNFFSQQYPRDIPRKEG